MRSQAKTNGLSTLDMTSPALRALADGCNAENAAGETEMQDFRTWWKANIKETRHWGGGPDGVWSGTTGNVG